MQEKSEEVKKVRKEENGAGSEGEELEEEEEVVEGEEDDEEEELAEGDDELEGEGEKNAFFCIVLHNSAITSFFVVISGSRGTLDPGNRKAAIWCFRQTRKFDKIAEHYKFKSIASDQS